MVKEELVKVIAVHGSYRCDSSEGVVATCRDAGDGSRPGRAKTAAKQVYEKLH